jgi:hypothetical protein
MVKTLIRFCVFNPRISESLGGIPRACLPCKTLSRMTDELHSIMQDELDLEICLNRVRGLMLLLHKREVYRTECLPAAFWLKS